MDGMLRGKPWPSAVLRQDVATAETRAVLQGSLLADIPCIPCNISGIPARKADLASGEMLAVGSVEFVREAFHAAGAVEPRLPCYPDELQWMLGRGVVVAQARSAEAGKFVKPVKTKLFTGFVMPHEGGRDSLSEHDAEQLTALQELPPGEPIYLCDPVRWLCEHRVYIHEGVAAHTARYDDEGDEDAPVPDEATVVRAVECLRAHRGRDITCALDVGVLSSGQTACVEVNDAWSIGRYGSGLSSSEYLRFLWTRWAQIMASRQTS